MTRLAGRALVAGEAEGPVVFTAEPLSFWGGYNAREGKIIDTHHHLCGENVAGSIFVLPDARGSSTGSGILLEAIRLGTAPAAMILARPDAILALGAIVGRELYGKVMPVIVLEAAEFEQLRHARRVHINAQGQIDWV